MKLFKDAFVNFVINEDYLQDVYIEKIEQVIKSNLIRIYIISEKIISRYNINLLEKKLADYFRQKYSVNKINIEIIEKFKLHSSYTPSYFYDEYKESMLNYIKHESSLYYFMFSFDQIKFDDDTINISVPDVYLIKRSEKQFIEYIKSLFKKADFNVDIKINYKKTDNNQEKQNITVKTSNVEKTDNLKIEKKKENLEDSIRKSFSKKTSKNPEIIYGKDFPDEFINIDDILCEGLVRIKAKIIDYQLVNIQKKNLVIIKLTLTDFTNSIKANLFFRDESYLKIAEAINIGSYIRLSGNAKNNIYNGICELEISNITGIKTAGPIIKDRTDTYPEKRTELHMHTKMSDFDGMASVKDLINTAIKWGWSSIAITDHGNVQAFIDANKVSGNIKKIYGMEGYIVDDLSMAIVNSKNQNLDDEYVVFDIETTGLNKNTDTIIEIGAVKIKNYEIVDTFSCLINPKRPLTGKIEQLTGISNNMLMDKEDISTVLPKFLKFIENSILVAHNASFDTGFIFNEAKKLNIDLSFTIIDTIDIARKLLPNLSRFKLDTVAKELKVELKNHHRALDDATCTAHIWLKFTDIFKSININTLDQINEYKADDANIIKKLRANHIILLAKNDIGRINLYKLVSLSNLNYFYQRPKIPKSVLMKHREGLIIGSACEAGELYQAILNNADDKELYNLVNFYDYLEIQPIENNKFLLVKEDNNINTIDDLREINKRIYKLGKKYNKPVVATGDVHFLNPSDYIYREIVMYNKKYADSDKQPPLYLKTTDEMMEEFSYLGNDEAYEVVIKNPNNIADSCEYISPFRPDRCPPVIENADIELQEICYKKAKSQYGESLPDVVAKRLEKELKSIINNGFAVMYIIAQKLVKKSNDDGYLVGSRGSVGSSFAAYTAGITEVNPLPPHYYCSCNYVDFSSDEVRAYSGSAGYDMPDKICPECGKLLKKDGFDIPFETFLGFKGDKEPDIDLNFSGEYQSQAHEYTEVIFGKGNTYRAGTVGTIKEKIAFGNVKNYYKEKNIAARSCEVDRIAAGLVGIKNSTGQHPGGIIVLPHGEDINTFTPIQKPADKSDTNVITTHFDYHAIDHNLLKLDILGHMDPTMIKMLQDLTGVDLVKEIPFDDKKTMSLFKNTEALNIKPSDIRGCKLGALGVPEFGTKFAMDMLLETKPSGISDLVRIAGLAHGTDVWLSNAQDLIRDGICDIKTAICTRDDIMIYLIDMGLDESSAFKIMESVRKGKGLSDEYEQMMKEHGVPEWYIDSCKKIKYMFPKAHAAAYVMMAWRIAYCKIYYPLEYYTAYFTIRASAFSYEKMCLGRAELIENMDELNKRIHSGDNDVSKTDKDMYSDMEVVNEMYARGFEFEPIDIYSAHYNKFTITEDKKIMPSFKSISGLGENAAYKIYKASEQGKYLSLEDFKKRTSTGDSLCNTLCSLNILKDLPASNQLSLF